MEPATQSTTSEDLYKVLLEKKCSEYREFVRQSLADFSIIDYEYNGNLKECLDYKMYLEDKLRDVRSYVVPTFKFNAQNEITLAFSSKLTEYKSIVEETEQEIKQMYSTLDSEHEEAKKAERARVESTISPLKKKHEKLISYKPKLDSIMEHYGISPGDVQLDQNITKEEFDKLLDVAIAVCDKFATQKSLLVDLAISPFYDEDYHIVIMYLAFLILLGKVALPAIGLVYMYSVFKNTKTTHAMVDDLRVASSLMHTVDYDRLIPESDRYVEPEKDTSSVDSAANELRDEVSSIDPTAAMEAEIKKFKTDAGISYISTTIENEINTTKKTVKEIENSISDKLDKISKICEEELGKIRRFGDYMNSSSVLDTKFTLGYVNESIPVVVDIGLENLNFVGEYTQDLVNHIKVLFLNMLLGVRANKLETFIYDPEYLGQSFSEFITPETAPYISIFDKSIDDFCEKARQQAAKNVVEMKTDDILTYNTKSEELGMITHSYSLYIILTGVDEKFDENKARLELFSYSAKRGVFFWIISKKAIPNMKTIKSKIRIPEGEYMMYDLDLGNRAIETFKYALENNKINALDYRESYLLKYLPRETWWRSTTIKEIKIRLGLQNGDPAKAFFMYFNDKNVHFLLGGATGAGKSVAIDCTMQSMLHEYAPDELQLVYLDLKNAEVAKYTKNGVCLIPHCIIAAGTTDGDYCLSIFDWLYKEMVRRLSICRKYGVQKVEDLRKKFDDPSREGYDPEVHIARVVTLIDEFQVMFNSSVVPQRTINEITGKITSLVKLARAASIHLWFTSQEMSGTLSKNVLDNFSTRGALRCTKEVSASLIGNDAAGQIKDKVGWMYSNDSAGQDPNANKLWKVPFAPGDDLIEGIMELREKAEKEGKPIINAKFFDEKEGRKEEDLRDVYKTFDGFKNPYFMVLGERTIYSDKPTPLNFRFMKDDKENLFIIGSERQDVMDLFGTVIDNIMYKGDNASLLINCADNDTTYLLDLKKYMPEGWEDFLSASRPLQEIFDDLNEVGDLREEEQNTENPLYIILAMWEKVEGVGLNENYRKTEEMMNIIRRLNSLNIHVIFISRDQGVPNGLIGMCNHKICAKVDEKVAMRVIDDTRPYNFPSPNDDEACFALYKYGNDISKFKLYRHVLTRELEAREL